ncbi:hypothetical protein Esi_0117_0037 [Ectocarpus siliculosus]|uniref:Uncharacterized protein n=1 Tax=Ectocarpus siliculosus TaxID=2880 RepID=D7FI38_ECTSI|nr:hypothetical protein Esi_0117_0037 [Ectocarpus siliculosus]|eukprot:CBJ28664.1 hypothetical protein Esi_0117_0037 [Ectocarpus siliculosus]
MSAWCFTPRKNRTAPPLSPPSTASPTPRDVASQEPGSCTPTFLRKSLSEYDALSIIEPVVLVASDNSFEELYHAAFRVNEEFWVKGSNLEGTSFPSSAEASGMWQVLGHINGNAIYNNDDPAFVEYVEYTRAHWGYEHPYDVALGMTISDFPYSWPLYQRYSSKFVVTNLISYVGDEHVTQDTVSDAVAGKTLFVHGGGVADVKTASAPPAPVAVQETARRSQRRRKLQKRKTRENWRRGHAGDETPKCLDGCEYTSKDGTRGRVCDANCSRRDVYGTLGCGTKDGAYGTECRACYNDGGKAHKQDTPENRVIMCSTAMPVDVRDLWLSTDSEDHSLQIAHAMEAEDREEEAEGSFERVDVDGIREGVISFFEEEAERPFFQDLKRGNLCAFVSGRVDEEAMWEVTVKSILQFMPGMRVAIAAGAKGLDAYERSMGGLPGVTISSTHNPATASLFADRFCGAGTALILYVELGSVLSRPFTSKDTHSPRGDLLVVHRGGQGSYRDDERSRRSGLVLGLEAPSFTRGTDLVLPVGANKDLRGSLGMEMHADSVRRDGVGAAVMALTEPADFEEVSAVPQARNRMLAALAYARNTPGVWFGDPKVWVGQHLFQEASIWDIPLVKPRFTCAIALALEPDILRAATTLQNNLDFFSRGGKCEDGLIEYLR